jgi:hypothetical protein
MVTWQRPENAGAGAAAQGYFSTDVACDRRGQGDGGVVDRGQKSAAQPAGVDEAGASASGEENVIDKVEQVISHLKGELPNLFSGGSINWNSRNFWAKPITLSLIFGLSAPSPFIQVSYYIMARLAILPALMNIKMRFAND